MKEVSLRAVLLFALAWEALGTTLLEHDERVLSPGQKKTFTIRRKRELPTVQNPESLFYVFSSQVVDVSIDGEAELYILPVSPNTSKCDHVDNNVIRPGCHPDCKIRYPVFDSFCLKFKVPQSAKNYTTVRLSNEEKLNMFTCAECLTAILILCLARPLASLEYVRAIVCGLFTCRLASWFVRGCLLFPDQQWADIAIILPSLFVGLYVHFEGVDPSQDNSWDTSYCGILSITGLYLLWDSIPVKTVACLAVLICALIRASTFPIARFTTRVGLADHPSCQRILASEYTKNAITDQELERLREISNKEHDKWKGKVLSEPWTKFAKDNGPGIPTVRHSDQKKNH